MIYKTFEQYLAEQGYGPSDEGVCAQCGEKATKLTRGEQCKACVKYAWGYDQAEEKILENTIGGAIKEALADEVSGELIMRIVHRAFDHHYEAERDDMRRYFANR